LPLTEHDITHISAALRSANFHLVSAQLNDQDREMQVTVSAVPGPLGDRGITKTACASYAPERALHGEQTAIPWSELTDREKFVVIGDIIALLRR
jgi:type II secretory pathway component PulM